MDAIAERELRKFGETLSASAHDKLRITEAAMEAQVGRIQGLLWRGVAPVRWWSVCSSFWASSAGAGG